MWVWLVFLRVRRGLSGRGCGSCSNKEVLRYECFCVPDVWEAEGAATYLA